MTLSIVTINYNNLEGLRKTIDSVLSQTWHDFEWIIIDGGSTDGSKELIEETANKLAASDFNPLSYWCSEPDNGIYNAMNKGIKHCNGEYINFMNSGDCFYDTHTLKKVFNIHHTADILYGIMLRPNGEINNKPNMKPDLRWYDFYWETLGHQAQFTHLTLLHKLGGFDETYPILADWNFNALAISEYHASHEFLPFVVAQYEGGGLSDTPDMGKDLARIRKEVYLKKLGLADRIDYIEKYQLNNSILKEYYLILNNKLSWLMYRLARKIAKIWH